MILHPRIWPKVAPKDLQLQREIEKIVLQTILTEASSAVLCFRIDAPLGWVAHPSRVEPCANFSIGEADSRGLVQAVQDLGIQPVTVHGDGGEVAQVEQRSDEMGHVVL